MLKTFGRSFLVCLAIAMAAMGCGSMSNTDQALSRVKINIFQPDSATEMAHITLLERSLGFKFNGATWYQNWDTPIDQAVAKRFADHGLIPTCVWESVKGGNPVPLTEIDRGDHDSYITETAKGLKTLQRIVRISIFPEMNGDWAPWYAGRNGNSPELIKRSWQRIVTIFRNNGATNVRFIWTVNIRYGGDRYSYAELYPDDKYVDLVALDGYNWGTGGPHVWTPFRDVFGRSYQELSKVSRLPILITETACAEHASGDKGEWISQMFIDLPVLFPKIREITWFNQKKERDWHIDSSPGAFEAFQHRGRILR